MMESFANFSGILSLGSRDVQTKEWQEFLNAKMGARLIVDGQFGQSTRAATIAFQKANGADADGKVGRQTYHIALEKLGLAHPADRPTGGIIESTNVGIGFIRSEKSILPLLLIAAAAFYLWRKGRK